MEGSRRLGGEIHCQEAWPIGARRVRFQGARGAEPRLDVDRQAVQVHANPRHVEVLLRDSGLKNAKLVATPGLKPAKGQVVDDTPLDRERHRAFRSVVARGNFLAQDCPDIRHSVKDLCRRRSAPRECHWVALKRPGRYLRGKPRLILAQSLITTESMGRDMEVYVGHELPWWSQERDGRASGVGGRALGASAGSRADGGDLHVMVESGWAGCRETGRSTSGGCVVHKGVCLKVWSSTQHHLALSSGEAEYYAAAKGGEGGQMGLHLESLCRGQGLRTRVIVHTGNSACKGICTGMASASYAMWSSSTCAYNKL